VYVCLCLCLYCVHVFVCVLCLCCIHVFYLHLNLSNNKTDLTGGVESFTHGLYTYTLQYECLPEILQEAVRYCDPHVVTGACKMLHNLLLEFPEALGAHVLTHSTIGTLIRSVICS